MRFRGVAVRYERGNPDLMPQKQASKQGDDLVGPEVFNRWKTRLVTFLSVARTPLKWKEFRLPTSF